MKNKKYYVYIHLFPNGKRYVGLTEREVNQRWRNGKAYKGQKVVYNAILKYGWDNISHQVFECDTEAEMKYLERYLIRFYNTTDHQYGYNVSSGGEYAHSGVPSKYRKPVDQYDKQGNFIKTWESLTAVEKELNYDISSIINCIKKRRKTAYNYYWVYSGEVPEINTYRTHRKVRQYDLNGNFIAEYKNATEAAKGLGRSKTPIIDCCNKKCKTALGFIFVYENDNLS